MVNRGQIGQSLGHLRKNSHESPCVLIGSYYLESPFTSYRERIFILFSHRTHYASISSYCGITCLPLSSVHD